MVCCKVKFCVTHTLLPSAVMEEQHFRHLFLWDETLTSPNAHFRRVRPARTFSKLLPFRDNIRAHTAVTDHTFWTDSVAASTLQSCPHLIILSPLWPFEKHTAMCRWLQTRERERERESNFYQAGMHAFVQSYKIVDNDEDQLEK